MVKGNTPIPMPSWSSSTSSTGLTKEDVLLPMKLGNLFWDFETFTIVLGK